MRPYTFIAILAALIFVWSQPATAIGPDEILDDPNLEARARSISKQLRCVVCQNQSIDDSNADIARDMRLIVRERLVAGDNDDQAIAFLVDRYGDYVLLDPPFKAITLPLWLGPPFLVLLVGLLVFIRTRQALARSKSQSKKALLHSPADAKRLDSLVGGIGDDRTVSESDRRDSP